MSLRQRGFTQVELMIVVAIAAILASVAISQYRDYARRSALSEVVLALGACKGSVSEGYLSSGAAPAAGGWGCERRTATGKYSGVIETSADGAIRVQVENLDGAVNGQFIYMIPTLRDGVTPMITPDDLGLNVGAWQCGSDWLVLRNSLPSNCRKDTTSVASDTFAN